MLAAFASYMYDIEVYALTAGTGAWGTTEKTYPATATSTISGYIQPLSASKVFVNHAVEIESTHRLYCEASVTLNDTDHLKYGGITYQITENPPLGVAGISDHKEIGLKVI